MDKSRYGKLYIVATPIGNPGDITYRAVEILKSVDAVICEEYRLGSSLLKRLDIEKKELLQVNEHTEKNQGNEIILRLARGQNLAMISDCGTPGILGPWSFYCKPGYHGRV